TVAVHPTGTTANPVVPPIAGPLIDEVLAVTAPNKRVVGAGDGDDDVFGGAAVEAGDGEFVLLVVTGGQCVGGGLGVVQGVGPRAGGGVERKAAVGALQAGRGGRGQLGLACVVVGHGDGAAGGGGAGVFDGGTGQVTGNGGCVVHGGDGDGHFVGVLRALAVGGDDAEFVRAVVVAGPGVAEAGQCGVDLHLRAAQGQGGAVVGACTDGGPACHAQAERAVGDAELGGGQVAVGVGHGDGVGTGEGQGGVFVHHDAANGRGVDGRGVQDHGVVLQCAGRCATGA
ncbi:hypothetical protein DAPPUDRAFT_124087, partial [Daphnia pulex]